MNSRWLSERGDPVARLWIDGEHPTAARLLRHAQDQYDVGFRLTYNVRPWASAPAQDAISGTAGVFWHATWIVGRDLNAVELWREISRLAVPRDLVVHLLIDPGSVTGTFSAVDDPDKVADAIGYIFDEVIATSRPHVPAQSADEWAARWTYGAGVLPGHVQVRSPLTLVDPYFPGASSIFAAD